MAAFKKFCTDFFDEGAVPSDPAELARFGKDKLAAKREELNALVSTSRYPFVSQLAAFYVVAAIFGFIYAGVMPLYAVIARDNFPLKMMGTVIGGTAMAGGLGMALGPVAGGLIYDTFASYSWLYIGAWGMGLGATLMAFTFKPFRRSSVGTTSAIA